MTGWGQTGPWSSYAGHDINYLALSGALSAIGRAELPPSPPLNLLADFGGGGMFLAVGLLAALAERQSSGRGQVVDVSMLDGVASLMGNYYGLDSTGLLGPRGSNLLDGGDPAYEVYECADQKFIAIGALEQPFYESLCDSMGLAGELWTNRDDPSTSPLRKSILRSMFLQRPRDEWCDLLEGSDACVAPVLSMSEAPTHVQHLARNTFSTIDGVTHPVPAPRFDRTPGSVRRIPGPVGADTDELLDELGFSADDIRDLRDRNIVY
jgi:alpha-methylacyl-CoA racemase